jgi:hypothetical protein
MQAHFILQNSTSTNYLMQIKTPHSIYLKKFSNEYSLNLFHHRTTYTTVFYWDLNLARWT